MYGQIGGVTSRVQYNILDVHHAAVISAFHQNVCNRKMREELAMNKVKDVAELYVLADRCARAEEGMKYPGQDAGAETDSTDEDTYDTGGAYYYVQPADDDQE